MGLIALAAGSRGYRHDGGPFPLLLPEPECPDYGKRGLGNLTVCSRYGKHKHIRLLYCRTCRHRFSERKGTPLFGSQLPQDKAVSLFQHLADRNGVRATARLVGVRPQHRGPLLPPGRRPRPGSSTTSSWPFPPEHP